MSRSNGFSWLSVARLARAQEKYEANCLDSTLLGQSSYSYERVVAECDDGVLALEGDGSVGSAWRRGSGSRNLQVQPLRAPVSASRYRKMCHQTSFRV